MLGLGLQYKTVEDLSTDLEIPSMQLLGLFNRAIRRITQYLSGVLEQAVEKTLINPSAPTNMNPTSVTLQDELEEAASVSKFCQNLSRIFVFSFGATKLEYKNLSL